MKKYKLINKTTKEEHLCTKVLVDGWEYYVSGEPIKDVRPHEGKWHIEKGSILNQFPNYLTDLSECKLVLATNNPNSIDIPKVIDEFGVLSEIRFIGSDDINNYNLRFGFEEGYNKAKETYSFTEEDMVEFLLFVEDNYQFNSGCWVEWGTNNVVKKETLLQIWKEQRLETIYFQ